MSSEMHILSLYNNRDFANLSKQDLSTPVDSEGNTIIHVIAQKLDKNAIESLLRENPNSLSYSIINKSNNNLDLPIHLAMKTIEQTKRDQDDFITFLIEKCGANPNVPNKDGLTIKKVDEVKIVDIADDFAEVRAILDTVFKTTVPAVGGYSGRRFIKNKLADFSDDILTESGSNDYFSKPHQSKLSFQDDYLFNSDRVKSDPKVTEAYNAILKRIMEVLNVDEETAKLYRIYLKRQVGNANPELRKRVNDALKIKEIEKILGDNEKTAKKELKKISKESIEELRKWMHEHQLTRTVTTDTPEKKPKKTLKKAEKPKKKSKKIVSENGYLHSSELLFSPDY